MADVAGDVMGCGDASRVGLGGERWAVVRGVSGCVWRVARRFGRARGG